METYTLVIAFILLLLIIITSGMSLTTLNQVKDGKDCVGDNKCIREGDLNYGRNAAIAGVVIGVILLLGLIFVAYRKQQKY